MVESLGEVTLKSGERAEAAAIRGPDEAWRPRLARLLEHKGEPWNWQNLELLSHETGLDAWFYVLHRAGQPFAHIMTAERGGVGLFGHVWTEPPDRQQGAAARLMALQMAHFRRRDGRALFLHTSHDSPAFQLYRRHGFESVEPRSGTMVHAAQGLAEFEASYFSNAAVSIDPIAWRHWPAAAALFTAGIPGVVRCAPLKILGRQTPEGHLLPWIQAAAAGRTAQIMAATTPNGAVVGLAAWDYDPLTPGFIVADVFCHPLFWSHAPKLIRRTLAGAPAGRRVAYGDSDCPMKQAALGVAGFRVVATWPKRLAADVAATRFADLVMFEHD